MPTMTQRFIPLLLSTIIWSNSSGTVSAANSAEVPARASIATEYQWHLQDIYASDELWDADVQKLKTMLPAIKKMQGTLAASGENLKTSLEMRDEISIISSKLYAYARMHRDENTANTRYQALTGQTEGLLAEASAAAAFIEPEILAMPEKTLMKFRKEEKGLAPYQFYFDNLLRQKQHVLSPNEEEILSRSSEATAASENTFNMLAHADMKFPFVTDEQGNSVQLSEGRYRSFIMSPNREVRREAFINLFSTYNQYRNTFASTLNGSVKKNIFYAQARKYAGVLPASLEADNIPVAVYDNLIETVHNNLGPLHRYVALKKKYLALDEIHMYDLYTPIVRDVQLTYNYPDGIKLMKDGLHPLGSEYAAILDKGLSGGWIDVYENKGKQTGAYSWGIYGVHPFVLLNYHDRYDDVSTVAHEMGHAIHSYYSQSSQPYATASYTTFCAEVASTTNEVLLIDHMLKITADKQQRLFLLNQYLESIRATVYRQTMFAEFEKIIFDRCEKGETLTADMLDAIWHDLNTRYYGPDIIVDNELNVEWARIPHFYWSFYVYKYVTGYSAATALAEQLQTEGPAAQTRYIEFLKSGGSDYSLNLLKRAGVDMSSPQPIEVTLHKFNSLLDELEKLLENP
ncbi:MAG: oligoendopeptidase [Firmicutes bacterium]|nr:oligoendopeptidase [Bacillota bacterium]